MGRLRAISFATVLLASSNPAIADILVAENIEQLCTTSYDGKPAVDPDQLAFLIATEANAERFLDGSNTSGTRNKSIDLSSDAVTVSEPTYAILNSGAEAVANENRPFGPNVDLSKNKLALAARDKIVTMLSTELVATILNGHSSDKKFSVIQHPGLRETTNRGDAANPLPLFGVKPSLVLVCTEKKIPTPSGQEQAQENGAAESSASMFKDVVKIRGAVKDLAVEAEALKDAKPAKLSLQRDDIAEADALSFNGVVGITMETGPFSATPFFSYENQTIDKKDTDVEKISPGLLLSYGYESADLAATSSLEFSYMGDLEQNSKQLKMRLYIEPAFRIPESIFGPGNGILFGSYLSPIGPLKIRPDLTLIADVSHVLDTGSSDELDKANNYVGLGGQAMVVARLDLGEPISDFAFKVGVRDLEIIGDLDEGRILRWFAGVEYAPQEFPYLGIGFSYSNGENDDTFQEEDRYELSLSVKY